MGNEAQWRHCEAYKGIDKTGYPNCTKYTFQLEEGDNEIKFVCQISLYYLQACYYLSSSLRNVGLLCNVSKGWLKKGWKWLDDLLRKWTDESSLTHKKHECMALNYCIEYNYNNINAKRSKRGCKYRCDCRCGMDPKCLNSCNKSNNLSTRRYLSSLACVRVMDKCHLRCRVDETVARTLVSRVTCYNVMYLSTWPKMCALCLAHFTLGCSLFEDVFEDVWS